MQDSLYYPCNVIWCSLVQSDQKAASYSAIQRDVTKTRPFESGKRLLGLLRDVLAAGGQGGMGPAGFFSVETLSEAGLEFITI